MAFRGCATAATGSDTSAVPRAGDVFVRAELCFGNPAIAADGRAEVVHVG